MKTIELPCYGIKIVLGDPDADGGVGGEISTELHALSRGEEDERYDAAIDGMESLILACACAGVDVESTAFLEAIETTVEAAANNL